MSISPRFTVAAATVLLSIQCPLAVLAQDTTETAPESAVVAPRVDPDLPPIEVPIELLEQLNKSAQDADEKIKAINEVLQQDLSNIENAEQIFDDMIQTIRNAAANGAPDSQFVTMIEELATRARKDAAEAEELGVPKLVEYYKEVAASFEESKGKAISYYTNSFRNVREIERHKRRFVLGLRAKSYALAKQSIEQGLAYLETLDDDIAGVRNALPDVDVPMESQ